MPAANLNSPRSAIIDDTRSPSSSPTDKMASTGGVEVDKAALSSDGTGAEKPGPNEEVDGGVGPEQKKNDAESGNTAAEEKDETRGGDGSPTQSNNSYPQGYVSHLTPQQGYYMAYQSQVTPESPTPAGYGPGAYDVGSFFQQPGAGFHNSLYPGGAHQQGQQPPGSPSQSNSMSVGPPPSPLFPRLSGQATAGLLDPHRMVDHAHGAPLSPAPSYLTSPGLNPSYQNMYAVHGSANSNSPDGEYPVWNDSRNHQTAYHHNSAQGIPIPYVPGMPPRSANAANRSYSFEETAMLPPPAMSEQSQQDQQGNPAYSPYGSNQQNGMPAAGTLFAHQQPWGYGAPPPDSFSTPGSPHLQARPAPMGYPGPGGGGPGPRGPHPMAPQHPHMAQYGGQFFPATSPGPPIQTTTSNKGPDGANLFIFHIPNHFTNLDMYQLFGPYGNLLSVRIMVEKDTGRSRGFGFVSYDTPDAAALAIKELNGFAIGNKRLKVQHKQIRPSDQHHGRDQDDDGGFHVGPPDDSFGRGHNMTQSLPPSGPNAMNAAWYNRGTAGPTHVDGGVPEQHEHEQQQQQEEGGQPIETISGAPPADAAAFADPNQPPLPSPLSNMEALHQTLPEVGGAGGE